MEYPPRQGPHSVWPYETGDPQKSDTERAGEASKAFALWMKNLTIEAVAEQLEISRATAYRRIKQHAEMHDQPTRSMRQLRSETRVEQWIAKAQEVIESDATATEKQVVLLALKEMRMLDLSMRKLFATDEAPGMAPEPPLGDDRPDAWVDGARSEADTELAEIEARLREHRNGAPWPS